MYVRLCEYPAFFVRFNRPGSGCRCGRGIAQIWRIRIYW